MDYVPYEPEAANDGCDHFEAIPRPTTSHGYRFGDFEIWPDRIALVAAGRPIKLGSRAFDILHLLVSRAGQIITRQEIFAHVWPRIYVHEDNLKVNISLLRQALGDAVPHPRYIATIPGRGYRFIATVEPIHDDRARHFAAPKNGEHSQAPGDVVDWDEDISAVTKSLEERSLVTLSVPGARGKTLIAVSGVNGRPTHDYLPWIRAMVLQAKGDARRACDAFLEAVAAVEKAHAPAFVLCAVSDSSALLVIETPETEGCGQSASVAS